MRGLSRQPHVACEARRSPRSRSLPSSSAQPGIQRVARAKRKPAVHPELVEGFVQRSPVFHRHTADAAGAVTFLASPRKSNQKKATPTIGLILRCSEKSGTARNSLRSNSGPF